MKQIEKGSRVIALTSSPTDVKCQPRIKGQLYTVNEVKYQPCCGAKVINIQPPTDRNIIIECDKCNKDFNTGEGRQYTYVEHFALPEELSDTLDKCIEDEDYERAAKIRDLMVISFPDFKPKELIKKQ